MKILKRIISEIRPVEIIRRSEYFDSKWYRNEYDVDTDAAVHYLNEGWKKGYNPSNRFSTKDYLLNNPDTSSHNPLVHYEVFGKYEGRRPYVPLQSGVNKVDIEDVSLLYEDYFNKIADKDVVSFDVFDTLVIRPFINPTDLFIYMEKKYECPGFAEKRIEAEKNARLDKKKEVCLSEIYEYMDDELKNLMDYETQLEIKLCHRNDMIKPVYDEAKKLNKRIIAISDMYHSKDTVSRILKNSGYELDEVYVSCEYDMTKGNGDLYRKVMEIESIDSDRIVHFGDNYNSDYNQASLLNICAIQTPKNVDYFLSDGKNEGFITYLKKYNDLTSSIHVALISSYLNNNKDNNYFRNLGYVFGGPLSLGYLNFVCEKARQDDIDCLLFVARDGKCLKEVYDRYLYDRYGIESSYAYLSRAAIFAGNVENGLCKDIRKFLEIVKTDIPEIEVSENEDDNNREYIKYKDVIDEFSRRRSNNLRKHLEEISINRNRIATVDMVSGKFTSFKGARYYLKDRLKKGYFAGSFAFKNDECEFYCDRLLDPRDDLAVNLSEFLISSYEEAIMGLDDDGKPVYEKDVNEERTERYNLIMEGIFEYCDEFCKWFDIDNDYILDFDKWLHMTSSYLEKCCEEDLEILSSVMNHGNPVIRNTDRNFKELIEDYRINGY